MTVVLLVVSVLLTDIVKIYESKRVVRSPQRNVVAPVAAKRDATRVAQAAPKFVFVERIVGETFEVPEKDQRIFEAFKRIKWHKPNAIVELPAVKLPLANAKSVSVVSLPERSTSYIRSLIKDTLTLKLALSLRDVPYGYFFAYEDDTLAFQTFQHLVESLSVFAVPVIVSRTYKRFDLTKEPFRFAEWWKRKLGFLPEPLMGYGMLDKFKIKELPAFVVIKGEKARVYYGYY